MLKFLIFASALVYLVNGATKVDIKISYDGDKPELHLQLKGLKDINIHHVTFYYSVNGHKFHVKAAPVGNTWLANEELSDEDYFSVSAHAELSEKSGVVHWTDSSSLGSINPALGGMEYVEATKLPSRQIRAAVIFRDDFNDFSTSRWTPVVSAYGGYNGEFQVYTPSDKNIFARNGKLYIKPTLTTDDPRYDEYSLKHGTMNLDTMYPGYKCTIKANYGCYREGKYGILPTVMSGRLNSVATMKYGTVEVRAKIPQGDWIWPAIWMMPKYNNYGGWPKSGEIDIMESRGNQGSYGVGSVSSTLHWGPDSGRNQFMRTHGKKQNANWHNQYHTWKLVWTPDHLTTYIDDQQIMRIDPGSNFWQFGQLGDSNSNIWKSGNKMAPFDQEFYMILNVAVGGTSGFFPDNVANKPWNDKVAPADINFWNNRNSWLPSWNGDNTALKIDYVEFKSL